MWIARIGTVSLFLLVILSSCSGAKISHATPHEKLKILAIFAHVGKSHFDVFKPILEELARRGHDLTVISHFPRTGTAIAAEPLPNYKDISLFDEKQGVYVNVVDLQWIDDSYFRVLKEMYMLYYMSDLTCGAAFKNPTIKQMVESRTKFDVALVESFNSNCFMALVHKLDVPFVQISTHQLMPWLIDEMALSHQAGFIPSMLTRLPRPMNFLQRTTNALSATVLSTLFHTVFDWRDRSVIEQHFGPGTPDLKAISNNASLVMINTHYTLHGSMSFPPNVIEIGGVHISPKVKPLPKNIAEFLDEAREGVLYFNLGSMVKVATMPEDKLGILLKVFGSIPRKVIWKWETDDIPDLPSNVFVQKWLPQYDILNHPNVKCYFGHGGLLGLSEGVHVGVPMILMPLYGDQYQNSIAAEARGVALLVKFSELDEQTLRHAVDEMFNNTRYRENARRLSRAYRDRPATPLETAMWWIEYVGRGDGSTYARSEAANMTWCQRNLVDVAVFLVVVSLVALYVSYRIFKCLLSCMKRRKDSRKGAQSKKRN